MDGTLYTLRHCHTYDVDDQLTQNIQASEERRVALRQLKKRRILYVTAAYKCNSITSTALNSAQRKHNGALAV